MKDELWLSRDETPIGHYNLHIGDPGSLFYRDTYRNYIGCINANDFHQLFSVRLRKGRKKRIKSITIELVK